MIGLSFIKIIKSTDNILCFFFWQCKKMALLTLEMSKGYVLLIEK